MSIPGINARWLAISGALVTAALIAASPAQAANPACGATVTHDVKLTSDMDCSASNTDGLIVGKDGITINLNGHKITGPGVGSYYGIDNSSGYDHVTLENGTVAGYYYDVLYEYTTGSKIEHVQTGMGGTGEISGISFWYSKNGDINHSSANIDYGSTNYPIYLYENTDVNLLNSKVVDANSQSDGVYDYYSRDKIDNVKSNGGEYGFYLYEPFDTTITNSTANGNGYAGFYVYENYPAALYKASLSHNTANNNSDYGFYAYLTTAGKKNHASGNGTTNCYHVKCSH